MSRAPMRPGLASGLDGVVIEGFGVPVKPTESDADAILAIRRRVADAGIACEALSLSDAPVSRGTLFDASGHQVAFPHPGDRRYDRCLVALVDPERTARWGHQAWFAFYPAAGLGEVELVVTNMPEHSRGCVRLESVDGSP